MKEGHDMLGYMILYIDIEYTVIVIKSCLKMKCKLSGRNWFGW